MASRRKSEFAAARASLHYSHRRNPKIHAVKEKRFCCAVVFVEICVATKNIHVLGAKGFVGHFVRLHRMHGILVVWSTFQQNKKCIFAFAQEIQSIFYDATYGSNQFYVSIRTQGLPEDDHKHKPFPKNIVFFENQNLLSFTVYKLFTFKI
jgi:hypothetical protein